MGKRYRLSAKNWTPYIFSRRFPWRRKNLLIDRTSTGFQFRPSCISCGTGVDLDDACGSWRDPSRLHGFWIKAINVWFAKNNIITLQIP
jgi:hypothetical protein